MRDANLYFTSESEAAYVIYNTKENHFIKGLPHEYLSKYIGYHFTTDIKEALLTTMSKAVEIRDLIVQKCLANNVPPPKFEIKLETAFPSPQIQSMQTLESPTLKFLYEAFATNKPIEYLVKEEIKDSNWQAVQSIAYKSSWIDWAPASGVPLGDPKHKWQLKSRAMVYCSNQFEKPCSMVEVAEGLKNNKDFWYVDEIGGKINIVPNNTNTNSNSVLFNRIAAAGLIFASEEAATNRLNAQKVFVTV
jgi:hypothetical protein